MKKLFFILATLTVWALHAQMPPTNFPAMSARSPSPRPIGLVWTPSLTPNCVTVIVHETNNVPLATNVYTGNTATNWYQPGVSNEWVGFAENTAGILSAPDEYTFSGWTSFPFINLIYQGTNLWSADFSEPAEYFRLWNDVLESSPDTLEWSPLLVCPVGSQFAYGHKLEALP